MRGRDSAPRLSQVRVFHLRVDQRPAPPVQARASAASATFEPPDRALNMLSPKNIAADRHAVDAADQAVAVEDLDAVRMPQPMQLAIGAPHRRR